MPNKTVTQKSQVRSHCELSERQAEMLEIIVGSLAGMLQYKLYLFNEINHISLCISLWLYKTVRFAYLLSVFHDQHFIWCHIYIYILSTKFNFLLLKKVRPV